MTIKYLQVFGYLRPPVLLTPGRVCFLTTGLELALKSPLCDAKFIVARFSENNMSLACHSTAHK